MQLVDFIAYGLLIGAILAFVAIVWSYLKGLRNSPRDMWLLFLYKVVEYSAYAAANMAIILWLTRDCGLGDVGAGAYISAWSMMLSIIGMLTGPLIDTIGMKRTLILSTVFLLISKLFMSFITDPILIFALGFIPQAIGFAIVAPLVSVAIKRYTTKEGAALGFGLFYVVMNMAFASGGFLFDWFRSFFGEKDAAGKIINENAGTVLAGIHFSTYQLIFLFGLIATVITLVVAFLLREGISMNDDGTIEYGKGKELGSGVGAVKKATVDTYAMIKSVIREKYFWIFLGMLATTIPVRAIFFHFNYLFPKYGVRVLGEGAPIGNIFGVLNPVMIVFLVPLVAYMTKKTSSYKMLIVGSLFSSLSCIIAAFPVEWFASLTNSVLGELVFIKWLGMAETMEALMVNPPIPDYWPMIFFIAAFTVGEAIWSPRLMQFTAEIAPKGKEGTYIALSILPWFAAKFIVGPLSGYLLSVYTPLDENGKAFASYADHSMVWVWIGVMALFTPVTLLIFRNMFQNRKKI